MVVLVFPGKYPSWQAWTRRSFLSLRRWWPWRRNWSGNGPRSRRRAWQPLITRLMGHLLGSLKPILSFSQIAPNCMGKNCRFQPFSLAFWNFRGGLRAQPSLPFWMEQVAGSFWTDLDLQHLAVCSQRLISWTDSSRGATASLDWALAQSIPRLACPKAEVGISPLRTCSSGTVAFLQAAQTLSFASSCPFQSQPSSISCLFSSSWGQRCLRLTSLWCPT